MRRVQLKLATKEEKTQPVTFIHAKLHSLKLISLKISTTTSLVYFRCRNIRDILLNDYKGTALIDYSVLLHCNK